MQDAQIAIRPFADADQQAVRNLFVRINRELAPPEMREAFEAYIARSLAEEIGRIRAYYAERNGGFWVAEDPESGLVGMFGLESGAEEGTAELRRMYVDHQARRRGVARAMLRRAEEEAASAGHHRMILSTSELQGAALAFYRAAGYRAVREETAIASSNKTVGSGIRRFHFERRLSRQS